MKFIDLFCGIGGFRTALQKKGHECVFSSDIDTKAQAAYKENFNELPSGDITQIPTNKIPAHDILCAGFPCQPFSISGKHKGIDDSRGKLFYEIVRIASKHKPKIMLLENVKNILTIDNRKVIKVIYKELGALGYDVFFDVINASMHGIPQKRERVYFVCLKKGEGMSYSLPEATNEKIYLKDIVMDNKHCQDLIVDRKDTFLKEDATTNELKPIRIGYVNKAHQGERIYSIKGHSVTIAATTGGAGANTGLYLVDGKIRRLHIEECKEIMGFDASHKLSSGREGYKQLGNAVMPPIIEKVFNGIVA